MNIPIHSKDSSQIRSCQITLSHFQFANSTFFINKEDMPYGAPRIRAKKYTSHRSSLINKAPFIPA